MNRIHNPNLPRVEDVILHRRSALMLDGVFGASTEAGSAFGFWTPNNSHYDGHFDGMPILPAVKQIESGAQLGGYLTILGEEKPILPVFKGIENAEFERMIRPGETLDLQVELLDKDKRTFKGLTIIEVGGVLACRATIIGAILPEKVGRRMLEQAQ